MEASRLRFQSLGLGCKDLNIIAHKFPCLAEKSTGSGVRDLGRQVLG